MCKVTYYVTKVTYYVRKKSSLQIRYVNPFLDFCIVLLHLREQLSPLWKNHLLARPQTYNALIYNHPKENLLLLVLLPTISGSFYRYTF